jgi:hypothetical protein
MKSQFVPSMTRKMIIAFVLSAIISRGFAQTYKEESWFPFQPGTDYSNSRINMERWLDAPAGKHGFVQMKGDNIFFEDGKQIKFWGVNIASERPFLPHEDADKWAKFMAVYGINAVRFHKFTWDATDGIHSTQLTNDKWERFDYFNSALKKRGIYYGWSAIYGHRVLPADSSRLLAYTEVANTKFPWSHLNGSTAAIVNFAEDLQALNIELTVNMLNHVNPYNGLRYADDPALAYVELQNEDDIFWAAIEETLKQTPTYRALLCRKFSHWLMKKYGSQQALEAAWGKDLPGDQTLQKENIYPQPNHGFFMHESEKAWNNKVKLPQHVVDKAMFLYEEQNNFYTKFVHAIRSTGYKGLIVGSCWQAGSGLAHLLNLRADYNAGVVDRHNYFGGGTGHTLVPGKVKNEAMVSSPGSGLLSTGFQQVNDRPFFISESMSLIPNEWTAESSPIIAAYGLGLQDWDASFSFAMDFDHFTSTIQSGHGVYNVTSPTQLALYPALTSMIYRNDVRPAKTVVKRSVTIDQMRKGELPFFEKVEQENDIKKLQSVIPLSTLAKDRVVVSFAKDNGDKTKANTDSKNDSIIISSTNQLRWDYRKKGYFAINTNGTQGVVGFAKDQEIKLKDLSLKTSNEFAVILISSTENEKGLSSSKSILVTTVARARNTGMQYNEDKTQLLKVGEAPILLEPVTVQLQLNRKNVEVYVLDHSGHRTGEKVSVNNGRVVLDGNKYKTIYYEIVAK